MTFHTLDPKHVDAEIRRLVRPADQEAARALLEDIRDLGCWDVVWAKLAALNLSGGRIELLPQWVQRANADPRDLKMATLRHLDRTWEEKYQRRVTEEDFPGATPRSPA